MRVAGDLRVGRPEYFEITDSGEVALLREDVPAELVPMLQEAVLGCPTEALRLRS